jgi:hypothetical protein
VHTIAVLDRLGRPGGQLAIGTVADGDTVVELTVTDPTGGPENLSHLPVAVRRTTTTRRSSILLSRRPATYLAGYLGAQLAAPSTPPDATSLPVYDGAGTETYGGTVEYAPEGPDVCSLTVTDNVALTNTTVRLDTAAMTDLLIHLSSFMASS